MVETWDRCFNRRAKITDENLLSHQALLRLVQSCRYCTWCWALASHPMQPSWRLCHAARSSTKMTSSLAIAQQAAAFSLGFWSGREERRPLQAADILSDMTGCHDISIPSAVAALLGVCSLRPARLNLAEVWQWGHRPQSVCPCYNRKDLT